MIELATNTITVESNIGSHKAVRETIVPPVGRSLASAVTFNTCQSLRWPAEASQTCGPAMAQRATAF